MNRCRNNKTSRTVVYGVDILRFNNNVLCVLEKNDTESHYSLLIHNYY